MCDPGEPRDTRLALLDAARELPLDWLQVYGVGPETALARSLPEPVLHLQRDQVFHLDMPDGWEAAYRKIARRSDGPATGEPAKAGRAR